MYYMQSKQGIKNYCTKFIKVQKATTKHKNKVFYNFP